MYRARMRSTFTESERKRLLRAWRRSGMTARAFCDGRGVHPTTLYGWVRRYGSRVEAVRVGLVEAICATSITSTHQRQLHFPIVILPGRPLFVAVTE